jgi:general secretion pathway protein F
MPIYDYHALDPGGKTIEGTLSADTPRDARDKLRARGLYIQKVSEASFEAAPIRRARRLSLPPLFRRRYREEIALLTQQLGTLLKSGIPLSEALGALIEQTEIPTLQKILRDLREKVNSGATMADALANHPHYFGPLYVSMVRSGETSGSLDVVLKRLSEYVQHQNRLRNKVAATLSYPAFMLAIGIAVVTFLMTMVVPQLEKVFVSLKRELPLITRLLIGSSRFVTSYWWLVGLSALAGTGLWILFHRSPRGKRWVDTWSLRIPVIGTLLRKQYVARFANTMGTLLHSGVTAVEALSIVKEVIGNVVLADTIEKARQRIIEGADIATPLRGSGVFPPMVAHMIAVGEESGELDRVLEDLTQAMDDEIDTITQKVISLIEPVMIVAMSVVVGFLVLSIILPILDMTSSFGKF